ncbi:hypothetical protein J0B03_01955 [Alkalibacter rhizosphaerae]|uniref:Uncharacterized protein n=1 Tax=Alkalibacter rhizosphaerae TaxID=2815577 RepID=A0A975AIA5_9FIRM|nr:hypothetical protein [Alkalibacter rhizosphaerae]QSX08873.1 hypothetical protein J0B03_01955 [Alkalibacter rhizosphaerae]
MNLLTRNELETLTNMAHPNSVSIYFPMGKNYTDDKSKLVFKNLIKSAEKDLTDHGVQNKEVDRLLQPAFQLLETPDFWTDPSVSAAIFLHDGKARINNLPFPVDEIHYVGPNFYLLPLFELFALENKFHILSMSQNSIKLFHCDFLNWEEIPLGDIPTSLDEALQYDDIENERQTSSRSHGSAGDSTSGVYRGQGDGRDDHKTNLWRFLEMIDNQLHLYIKGRGTPIILAGVDYFTAMFQRVNSRYKVLETEINGNMDNATPAELHQKALPIASQYYQRQVERDLYRYHNMLSTDKTSTTIEEIASAAVKGKVHMLFATKQVYIPGIYNPELDTAFLKDGNPDSEDLINFAMVNTFKTGGKIHVLSNEQLPETTGCAALFRY